MQNIPDYWQEAVEAERLTSMRMGGVIDYLAKPRGIEELRETLNLAKIHDLPIKILGGGSNLLFADLGFRGVVIQYADSQITPAAPSLELEEAELYVLETQIETRYQNEAGIKFLHLGEIFDYQIKEDQSMFYLELGAGMPWGQAVTATLKRELIGLHYFARIPCQVGGAIFNNIHGEKHFVSESVVAVKGVDLNTLEERTWYASELEFGYDQSRFHKNHEFITSVVFGLYPAPDLVAEAALEQYLAWNRQKSVVQPTGANAGSVFKNLSKEDAATYDQVAAAWYIDQADLKGESVGGMQVYPGHANFIINTEGGTQADFISLVELIREKVQTKFNILLQPEVECIDQLGNKHQWPVQKS